MTNFFDTWSVIFDDNSKPLTGKIEFCEPNTTTLKSIYDVDSNVLQNPIYCNETPTAQVMLNGDYTVRFYRYVGSGNMENDENAASWFLYKTVFVHSESSLTPTPSEDIAQVKNIAALTDIENMTDGDVVKVLCYYDFDDCPERYYTWHESGNYVDDGGITIKSNSTTAGAWVMKVTDPYIDVRTYGDIPDSSRNIVTSSSNISQRVKAAKAADAYGKDLYFPSYRKGSSSFYVFDGSNTVSVKGDIIVDGGVSFIVKTGTSGTSVQCRQLKKSDKGLFVPQSESASIGAYSLTCDWIDTSWFYRSIEGSILTGARVGYEVNYSDVAVSLKNTSAKIHAVLAPNCVLDNVDVIEGERFIDTTATLKNLTLKSSWLIDRYDLTLSGCKILLDNCSTAKQYIELKNLQNESNYGDLQNKTVDTVTLKNGAQLSNATMTNVSVEGSVDVSNASLNIVSEEIGAVKCHNSTLVMTNATVIETLTAFDSSLTLGYVTCSTIELHNCNATWSAFSTVNVKLYDSNFNKKIITITQSDFNYDIERCSNLVIKEMNGATRNSIVSDNSNVRLNDSSSTVTSLGDNFIWKNNGDDVVHLKKLSYTGSDLEEKVPATDSCYDKYTVLTTNNILNEPRYRFKLDSSILPWTKPSSGLSIDTRLEILAGYKVYVTSEKRLDPNSNMVWTVVGESWVDITSLTQATANLYYSVKVTK